MASSASEVRNESRFFKPDVFSSLKITQYIGHQSLPQQELDAILETLCTSQDPAVSLSQWRFSNKKTQNNCMSDTLDAVCSNPHIKCLELDSLFLGCYKDWHDHIATINLHKLTSMKLDTLILNSQGFNKTTFQSLQRLLSDPTCSIINLKINGGLLAKEIATLASIFACSSSLKVYQGPGQIMLQRTLDKKEEENAVTASLVG